MKGGNAGVFVYMSYDELTPDQKLQVKQRYMMKLADEGNFVEVMYGGGEERGPSYGELADADRLVPDDVVRDGTMYTEEDFT